MVFERETAVPWSADERAYSIRLASIPRKLRRKSRFQSLAVAEWLSPATSKRYRREGAATYCNVYAHDFCHLLGAYLPRTVPDTVDGVGAEHRLRELTTNELFDWLLANGGSHGWFKLSTLDELQSIANSGCPAVVIATSMTSHGHVSVVLPEAKDRAQRVNKKVVVPVQSHAGALGTTGEWWLSAPFDNYAYWACRVWAGSVRPNHPVLRFVQRCFPYECASIQNAVLANAATPVSKLLVAALVAAEDRRFYDHPGYDIRAIVRSVHSTVVRRQVQGGSTIEQQFVRTVTGRRARTIWRKLTEVGLAAWCSSIGERDAIARAYLMIAYYGWRMNNLPEAARRLHADLSAISAEQASEIVAALRYPLPKHPPQEVQRRWRRRAQWIREQIS